MRIAVSADGHRLGSQVSPVFGRCPFFIMVEIENNEITDYEVLENSAMEKPSGSGTAAVQLIGDKNVEAVISGAVGPKAFSALHKWKIDVFRAKPGPVEQNIEKFLSNELEMIESPTGPAGMGRGQQEE